MKWEEIPYLIKILIFSRYIGHPIATFTALGKHDKTDFRTSFFMYCIKFCSEPIIAVDNAKEYICMKCLKKMLAEKWNIRSRK